jgi:hypothetical protein
VVPGLGAIRSGIQIATDPTVPNSQEAEAMLLAIAIVLLIIAIAGGVIIHPILFAIAIAAIAVYFAGRRGAVR